MEQLVDPEAVPTGPYAGPYDQAFAEDLEHYAEQEVTLRAQVQTVVSPVAFTITTPDPSGEDTEESGKFAPLLVMDFDDPSPVLNPGDQIEITGTVHAAYNVPDTEENLGAPPGPEVLAAYDGPSSTPPPYRPQPHRPRHRPPDPAEATTPPRTITEDEDHHGHHHPHPHHRCRRTAGGRHHDRVHQ